MRPPLPALRHLVRGIAALRSSFEPNALRPLAPGILAVAFVPFLLPLCRLEIKEPLFGDTAVFQYTGWCLRHGLRLYRDFGMADGPFIHYLHAGAQLIVGITDRGFRKWDLVFEAGGSATIGALLAPSARLTRLARFASRAAWAAMAAVVWLSWYLDLSWSDTTQRETYYLLFGSAGMVFVYASENWSRRSAVAGIFVGAFLATTQAFGKPTGVVYPAMGLLCVLLPSATASRRERLLAFVAGAGTCVLLMLVALMLSGSVRGYLFWCWRIPYVGNRYMWCVNWVRLFFIGQENVRMMAFVSLVSGTAAIASGLLPIRAIGFALVPPILFVGACLQSRGFNYQFLPVTGAFYLLLLLVLSELWKQSGDRDWASHRRVAPALALCFVGYYAFQNLQSSPYRWDGDAAKWETPVNHFADEEKKVGQYIKEHTRPSDRVFAYSAGENASIVLLNAERRTASPFFHTFWLDPVDLIDQSEIKPDAPHRARLQQLQEEIQAVACSAVERNAPAAMAFNLLEQVFKVCPKIRDMLNTDYEDATTIGAFHVYLRKQARLLGAN